MLSLNCKHVQYVKIYLPCNFEVNRNTHLGVIALFFINFFYNFNTAFDYSNNQREATLLQNVK
jgi:hypothetical protein